MTDPHFTLTPSLTYDEDLQSCTVVLQNEKGAAFADLTISAARNLASSLAHVLQDYDESQRQSHAAALATDKPHHYPEALRALRNEEEIGRELQDKLNHRRRSKMNTFKIVGMHFVNAKGLAAALPQDTTIGLVREPTNAYDSNAIQCWLDSSDEVLGDNIIVNAEWEPEDDLPGGAPLSSVLINLEDKSLRRIGYVPKEIAAGLAEVMDRNGWTQLLGRTVYTGEVLVEIDCTIGQSPNGETFVSRDEHEVDEWVSAHKGARKIKFDYDTLATA